MKKYLFLFIILTTLFTTTKAQKNVAVEYGTSWKNDKFEPFDSNYYTYNSDNYLVKKIRTLYLANQWRLTGKNEYSLNGDGEVDVESYFVRNHGSNSWDLNYKAYHTYNSDGLLEQKEYHILNNGVEELSTRYKYYYRADKNLDSLEYYKMDNNNLVRDEVSIYDYTGTGKLASITDYSKRTNWGPNDRWIYLYDFSEQLVKEENENFIGGSWRKISYYTNTYDNDGNLRKRLRKVTTNGNNISQTFYKYEGESSFLSIPETKTTTAKIFPNPFSNTATLSWDNDGVHSVNISDISGKFVKSFKNITGNTLTINGGDLEQGIYFYTMQNTSSGAQTIGKFIISR